MPILLLVSLLLAACSSDTTDYWAAGADVEYTLAVDEEMGFVLTSKLPSATEDDEPTAVSAVSAGTITELTGGFLQFSGGATTYGVQIPGYGIFMQVSGTLVIPFLEKGAAGCPSSVTWNWLGWRAGGNSDNTVTPFFGIAAYSATAINLTKRYTLAALADQGTAAIGIETGCGGGKAIGDKASGSSGWYFNSNAAVSGKNSSGTHDYFVGFEPQQIFASELTGSFTGVAIRRFGSDEAIEWPRYTATVTGANVGLVGNPVSLPADSVVTTKAYNLSLTSFNILGDGIATGTATVTDPSLTAGQSVSLNLACIGRKTLGSLTRPVLFCSSEGYTNSGASKSGGTSFHYILRGE